LNILQVQRVGRTDTRRVAGDCRGWHGDVGCFWR